MKKQPPQLVGPSISSYCRTAKPGEPHGCPWTRACACACHGHKKARVGRTPPPEPESTAQRRMF